MNYGKKGIDARMKQLSGRKGRARHHFLLVFGRTILICLLVLIAAGVVGGGMYVRRLVHKLPDASTINITPEGYMTKILDANGNEMKSLAAAGANRTYVTLDQIPKAVQLAFVDIEDERFYEHNGVDVRGVMRAIGSFITSGGHSRQGASTITQQLLKNNYFTSWTSESTDREKIDRKIQEQYLAIQLEKVTDKDTILENYLNTINLGQNTLGVEAASKRYFNKSVSELNVSEAALIAAITQNPSRYNPISHPKSNAQRRQKVLGNMLEHGHITREQYDAALTDNVYERIAVANDASNSSNSVTSYFVDALTNELIDDLMEKGYSEAEAYNLIYAGGLTVYSTENPEIQKIAEEELNNPANYPSPVKYSFSYRLTVTKPDKSTKNYSEQTMLSYYRKQNKNYNLEFDSEEAAAAAIEAYKAEVMEEGDAIAPGNESVSYTLQPQAACTIIDHTTGAVVALVGGRGEKTGSRTMNRASSITRQPGSTFKILAVYAPALDAKGLTLASVQDDCPSTYSDGKPLQNVTKTYGGYTTFREGIQNSINIVAVKTISQIGTGLGYEYVQKFGITTLADGDNNEALALGGITHGVTNLELTGAYAAIANGGTYIRPHLYTKVVDNKGKVILDNENPESHQVIKPTTAWLLTSAMQDVMTKGSGKAAAFNGVAMAGKTGTTNDRRDLLLEGFTPYYTCGVWGGYDDNSPQYGKHYPQYLWRAIMSRIHQGLPYEDFRQPDGIVQETVCRKSGKLPVDGVCTNDPRGDMTYSEYFAEGTEPEDTCDRHVVATIDTSTGYEATISCPLQSIRHGVFILNGSEETPDAPYAVSADKIKTPCPEHQGTLFNWFQPPEGETPEDGDRTPEAEAPGEITPEEAIEEIFDHVIDE